MPFFNRTPSAGSKKYAYHDTPNKLAAKNPGLAFTLAVIFKVAGVVTTLAWMLFVLRAKEEAPEVIALLTNEAYACSDQLAHAAAHNESSSSDAQ